ncbi:MAG: GtrA family protein [Candidatus Jorgensenbacteria bacterium GW2011_GWA1_48_11]|uniref:GtrA family protein n=1 Tax=Candidatus Jorgensenbacteria bacterium GW2011_GWA1_48_11 TaxID=1618660 RepID=A0A0G1UAS8_9BACT|nr:MAG: GtrA family protein [Candidatus Jorgensenbacteria bacterium GW2011_GWA1_48_11]KKW11890.1 MAG: GtrA family protein [Candidatus Jorgensenbacteria bacterium GW2011_GWB1_49_9]
MFVKKDFYLVTIIGFLVGALFLMPLANLGFDVNLTLVFASIIGFTVFAPIALGVLGFLSRYFKVLEQFGKFAAVGTLNSLLDIATINFFIFVTDIPKGIYYSLFVVIGFLVAATNSYFWNKIWTFQDKMPVTLKEYLRFAFFTLIGALLNASAASFVVNFLGAPVGFNLNLWANIGALCGIAASLLWNFLSYKNIVFKHSGETQPFDK